MLGHAPISADAISTSTWYQVVAADTLMAQILLCWAFGCVMLRAYGGAHV